jgi:hypothetical protein
MDRRSEPGERTMSLSHLPVAFTIWRRVSRCHGAGVTVVPGRLSRWPGDVLSGAGLVSQACVTCLDDGLCLVGDLQLGQDVGYVITDRLLPSDSWAAIALLARPWATRSSTRRSPSVICKDRRQRGGGSEVAEHLRGQGRPDDVTGVAPGKNFKSYSA